MTNIDPILDLIDGALNQDDTLCRGDAMRWAPPAQHDAITVLATGGRIYWAPLGTPFDAPGWAEAGCATAQGASLTYVETDETRRQRDIETISRIYGVPREIILPTPSQWGEAVRSHLANSRNTGCADCEIGGHRITLQVDNLGLPPAQYHTAVWRRAVIDQTADARETMSVDQALQTWTRQGMTGDGVWQYTLTRDDSTEHPR